MTITGILPPMITPFTQNGDVDYDAFVHNIRQWNKEPLAGYLVLGSNSETAYLTETEKLTLIELTAKTATGERIILAGTGLESTRETIRFTNEAAKAGAQAALVLTPHFYGGKMNDKALMHHFIAVADHSQIPILIYNVPKFTHINVSVELVHALSSHQNIIGMKDSSGNVPQLETFKKNVPPNFNLIVGTASALYPAFVVGVRAGILALANCAPARCSEIAALFLEGKLTAAQALQERMTPVNKAVTETYGIAGLKYACTLMGYRGGEVRSPLLALTGDEKKSVAAIMTEAGLL